MKRPEALQRWREIAEGALDDPESGPFDYSAWIRGVAAAIVEADSEPVATRRPARIVEATGLAGMPDRYADLKMFIERNSVVFDFWPDDIPAPTRAQKVNVLYSFAQREGLFTGYYAEEPRKARDLIRQLLPK